MRVLLNIYKEGQFNKYTTQVYGSKDQNRAIYFSHSRWTFDQLKLKVTLFPNYKLNMSHSPKSLFRLVLALLRDLDKTKSDLSKHKK